MAAPAKMTAEQFQDLINRANALEFALRDAERRLAAGSFAGKIRLRGAAQVFARLTETAASVLHAMVTAMGADAYGAALPPPPATPPTPPPGSAAALAAERIAQNRAVRAAERQARVAAYAAHRPKPPPTPPAPSPPAPKTDAAPAPAPPSRKRHQRVRFIRRSQLRKETRQ